MTDLSPLSSEPIEGVRMKVTDGIAIYDLEKFINVTAAEHTPEIRRRQTGMTMIRPARPLYGTTLRCSCGWTCKSNDAPSKGGKKKVLNLWEQHVAKAS